MVAKHRHTMLFITITTISLVFVANWLVTAADPEPEEQRALVSPASGEPQLQPIPESNSRKVAQAIDAFSRQADGNIRVASHSAAAAAAVAMASVGQTDSPKIHVTKVADGDTYDWVKPSETEKIYLITDDVTLHFENLESKAFDLYFDDEDEPVVRVEPPATSAQLPSANLPDVGEVHISVAVVEGNGDGGATGADDEGAPAERKSLITLVLPSPEASITKPSITEFATNEFAEASPASGAPVVLFGDQPYLRLLGRDKPADAEFRLLQTRENGGRQEIRELPFQPNVTVISNIPGAWQSALTLDLPTSNYPTSSTQSHHLRVLSLQQGRHVYSAPLTFQKHTIGRASKPAIVVLERTDDLSTAAARNSYEGAIRINRTRWPIRVQLPGTAPSNAFLIIRDSQKREPVDVSRPDGFDRNFEVSNLSLGVQQLTAEIWQGNVRLSDANGVRAVSDPVRVHVRTQGPRVERVEPKNFGTAPGVRTLNISFTSQNPLKIAAATEEAIETELEKAIDLRPSDADGTFAFSASVPDTQFKTRFNPETNTVSLRFTTLDAALYQLTIDGSQLTDVYGNKLEGQEDQPGTAYVEILGQQAALAGLDTTEPSVRPGISGATGPYVQYPEFTEPRSVPDGFNPHDKVETRVARLYYYRDAHRVAQIINRRVRSYNRQGVDMQRQLADKARTLADQTTAARQAAERKAIDEAEATRRAENELEAAQRSLDQTLTELTTAQRRGEPDEIVQSLDAAAQRFAGQVESLQDQVEHAREREIEATEDAEQLESDERLARAEQFRREVAAAHADPDTYAPGRPRSRDPVEQVSVSVIGEGLIHLRGPIKGINTIRLMIDQIDSPLGQTRISVHTVQINGEDESRMEDVANIAQLYIDQSRFLTLQSSEMLRRAVVQVAARKAEEARHLYPGESQEARDQRYLHAFFGRDFINELIAIDSEFLQTGNKLLSLHSMDTTSLSSALNLMALAKNSTREEILAEFDIMVQTELPAAEARNLEAGLTAGKKHKLDLRHPPKFYPLAQRAQFQSLRAFFNAEIIHDDTMTPLQREFIRLAQIFKSRLITEIEYKQRVMERAVIEERGGNYKEALEEARQKEETANELLARTQRIVNRKRQTILASLTEFTGEFLSLERELAALADYTKRFPFNPEGNSRFLSKTTGAMTIRGEEIRWEWDQIENTLKPVDPDDYDLWKREAVSILSHARRAVNQLQRFKFEGRSRALLSQAETRLRLIDTANFDPFYAVDLYALYQIYNYVQSLATVVTEDIDSLYAESQRLVAQLGNPDSEISTVFQNWVAIRARVMEKVNLIADPKLKDRATGLVNSVDNDFREILPLGYQLETAKQEALDSRRPLDHKKFLDMLIDQLEEKYIELLEGTRAHTANVDNYLKRLTTALDDDFNTQFYNPTFRYVRETSTYWDVQFGQTETTSILTNNRQLAKVSPSATMEFDLPKRDILMNEALNGAMANVQDFGALLNDPTFLAAAQLEAPNSTATPPAGTTSGFGVVRDVLPGLDSGTSEDILAQNADGRPQFGSNLENLIPDPAIYKFETGTGFEIRPVIQPDGQAVVFDFNYMYTTNIREPVRADEKHLGRVKRHYIDTDVQLSNFELREVSRYTVALKAARTSQGVPLLQDIPLIGALWRPLPSQESSLQQNVILAQATIFPTLFDLMGLRWAPAIDDLDPLRLSNQEFIARGRHRELQNRVYDHSSAKVDEFLRIPEPTRRADLYRTQESVPRMHPNGYQGPGLDLQDSHLQEGYQPERAFPEQKYIPAESKEGAPFLPGRRYGHAPETYIDEYPLDLVAPGEPDPEPLVEPLPPPVVDPVNYLYR